MPSMPVLSSCGGSSVAEHTSPIVGGGSIPAPSLQTPELYLEFCSSTDPRYIAIRKDHYVVHKGAHGQQVHFLIWYRGVVAGVISGAGAVYCSPARDTFFGITKQNREKVLNGIVDNVVFRLINHEHNLGTRVLALWERAVAVAWQSIYGVDVFGFETFIVRQGLMREIAEPDGKCLCSFAAHPHTHKVITVDDPEGNIRRGNLYRAANWTYAGLTQGSTKGHDGVGLTGGEDGGKGAFLRKVTPVKDVYSKWNWGHAALIEMQYHSSWKAGTAAGTPEEKRLAKQKQKVRLKFMHKRFYLVNRKVVII